MVKTGRKYFTVFILYIACHLGFSAAALAAPSQTEFDATAAWVEFEHELRQNYAYFHRSDFDVEDLLSRSRVLAETTTSPEAFRAILRQISYSFTDPHLVIGPLSGGDYNVIMTSSDLTVTVKDNKYSVQDVRKGSKADKANIRPGWALTHIAGVQISDAVKKPFGDTNHSPTQKQLSYAATLVANGKREGNRLLTFDVAGEKIEVTLPSPRIFALAQTSLAPLEHYRIGTIGVIRINNSLGNNATIKAFDNAMMDLKDTSGLIIDLRNTPSGGNTEVGRSIIGHFIKETRPYQIHEIPLMERVYTVPRRFIELVKPREPFVDPAKVIVLGGHWTGSMGEGIVIGLNGAAGIQTVTSDMGDLLGGLWNIDLAHSGAKMDLGGESLFHIDGTPRENYVGDISLSSADRDRHGNDPALTVAIDMLKTRNND